MSSSNHLTLDQSKILGYFKGLVYNKPQELCSRFKDETPISLTDYHYYIREDGSLEIYTAEATDTGEYRCQAINEAGEIEKVVNLFVQGRCSNSLILLLPFPTLDLSCGECRARSQWYLNHGNKSLSLFFRDGNEYRF